MTQITYRCGDNIFNITLPDHHRAHEWINGIPGNDVVSVHPRMLAYLRTTILEDTVIANTTAFYYISGGAYQVFGGDTINLTSYLPTTENNVKIVLVGLNLTTKTLEVIEGTETFDSALTPPPLPDGIPNNWVPSAFIKLRYNQTEIPETDVTDARIDIDLNQSGGGGGASAWTSLTDTPSSFSGQANLIPSVNSGETDLEFVINGNWPPKDTVYLISGSTKTSYSTFTAATAAAVNGDFILIGPGTFVETNLYTDIDCTILGSGTDATVLTTTSTSGLFLHDSDVFVSNLSIETTINQQFSSASGLRIQNCNVRIQNVRAFAENTHASAIVPSYGLWIQPTTPETSSTLIAWDCEFIGTSAATNGAKGIHNQGFSEAWLYHCYIEGDSSGTYAADLSDTDGDWHLYDCVFEPAAYDSGSNTAAIDGTWHSKTGQLNLLMAQYSEETAPATGDWLLIETGEQETKRVDYNQIITDASADPTLSEDYVNLIRNYPSLELADGTQPEWWEENANAVVTEEDATGASIPQKHERVLKCTWASGVTNYFYQRFVHTDEPGLDSSVTNVSASCWVYNTDAGGEFRLELYDVGGAASLIIASTTTKNAWTYVEIEAETIGTTSTDLRFYTNQTSTTFYVAKPVLNVGDKIMPWKPRTLVYIHEPASSYTLNTSSPATSFTDVDFTSATDPLAVVVSCYGTARSTAANDGFYVRRNGDTGGAKAPGDFAVIAGAANTYAANTVICMMDDGQVVEYAALSANVNDVRLGVHGYWRWET